jgi:hypothetical protein
MDAQRSARRGSRGQLQSRAPRRGYLYQYARTDVPDYYDNRTSTADQPNRGWIASNIALFAWACR